MGDYYGRRPWHVPNDPFTNPPPIPTPKPWGPPIDWTKELLDKVKELMEHGKKLDEKMGEPDCERPEKTDWMKQIEERLEKLEKVKSKKSK